MKKRAYVILYTRPGCHLCEEAKAQIRAAACTDEYTFEEINITGDPALVEHYGWEIPVVTINGIKAFKYRLTAAEFKSSSGRLARTTTPGMIFMARIYLDTLGLTKVLTMT